MLKKILLLFESFEHKKRPQLGSFFLKLHLTTTLLPANYLLFEWDLGCVGFHWGCYRSNFDFGFDFGFESAPVADPTHVVVDCLDYFAVAAATPALGVGFGDCSFHWDFADCSLGVPGLFAVGFFLVYS